MTLFKSDYINLEIKEVEIQSESQHFVIEAGAKNKYIKHCDRHGYFKTKQDAKNLMLFRLDQQRTDLLNRLHRIEQDLEKARQM